MGSGVFDEVWPLAKTTGEHSSTWKYFNDHHDHYHDLVNDNDHDDHLNDDVKHGDKRKRFVSRSQKQSC